MDLQSAAADSAGLATDTDAIVNTQEWMLYQLRLLDDQIEQVEAAIGAVLEEWPPQDRAVLASFPAMTIIRQAVLLASIGDIACFRDDRQLRKLLGWCPEARESGSSLSRHRLGLSGSRMVRRELWLWAWELITPSRTATPFPRLLPPPARTWHGWPCGHGTSGRQADLRPFPLSAQRNPL